MAKSRSNGKLVDIWWFEYEGVEEPLDGNLDEDGENKKLPTVKPIKVPVKVYIYKEYKGDTPPLSAKEVWFVAKCEKPEIVLRGPDIEAIRAALWGELKKAFAVKWESYFLVEILQSTPYYGIGSGLTFGYETVYKGTAYDGTLLLKHRRWGRGDVIESWPGEFRSERAGGKVIACIPDTDMNRKAMREFSDRIDLLREKLADLVRPANIENTLLTLASNRLLPRGDE